MVYRKNINEEAEVDEEVVETEERPDDDIRTMLKAILDKLDCLEEHEEEEHEEMEEMEDEACKETALESAQLLTAAMSAAMASDKSVDVKLEAVAIMTKGLKKIMEEVGLEDETAGGLPEEAAENEYDEETCSIVGERKPTDVDVKADFGEEEIKESAADIILKILNK